MGKFTLARKEFWAGTIGNNRKIYIEEWHGRKSDKLELVLGTSAWVRANYSLGF